MKFFILLLILNSTILFAQEKTSSQEIKKHTQEINYIKIIDVTTQTTNILSELKKIENDKESKEIKTMQESIKHYCNSIEVILKEEGYHTIHKQNVRELQKMRAKLDVHLKQLSQWKKNITINVKKYDTYTTLLKKYQKLWIHTYNNALSKKAPKELIEHILSIKKEINLLTKKVKIKYDKALTNAQLTTTTALKLNEVKENLKKAELVAINRVFYQNHPPLYRSSNSENFTVTNYINSAKKSLLDKYHEVLNYITINAELLLQLSLFALLGLIFVFYYNYLFRTKRLFVQETSQGKKIFLFIGRPFSTYLLLFVLLLVITFTNRPASFGELILLFIVIPTIRILQTVINKSYYKYIYLFFTIYTLQVLKVNAVAFNYESRLIMLLIDALTFIYIATLLYKKVITNIATNKLTEYGSYLFIIFLFVLLLSIGANIYGSVLLASRITHNILSTLYISMLFYTLYIILTGYIVVILRRRISSASHMLDKYAKNIEISTHYLIKIWMLLWWILIVTKLLSIYPYLIQFEEFIMSLSWEVAQTTISIKSIVNFFLIAVSTYILARFVRTILEVEVFARFKLPRGAPTAIITTLNYTIVITGTIIAFSSLGVTPQQFALIFGALGVGIGFGLRNIIANFVSGIIMVFERPIQIGDTIELDNTIGNVQSIGARSSTIKTFDGSEVIIPNADFIAKEIINWTLSDKYRRKIIEFKVDLDNDIEAILKIMEDIALAHKDVLIEPKPLATFKNFGEYYLEFKLYFWLSQNLIVAHSEINLSIYKALKEAGVKMPVKKTNIQTD